MPSILRRRVSARAASVASMAFLIAAALGPPAPTFGAPGAKDPAGPARLTTLSEMVDRQVKWNRFRFRTRGEFVGKAEMIGLTVVRSAGGLAPDACQVKLSGYDTANNGKDLRWWKVHRSKKECRNDNDNSCVDDDPYAPAPCFWAGSSENDYGLGDIFTQRSWTGQYCSPIEVYTAWYELDANKHEIVRDISQKVRDINAALDQVYPGNNVDPWALLPPQQCGITSSTSLSDIATCALAGHDDLNLAGLFWSGHDGQPFLGSTGCQWMSPDNYGDISQTHRNKTAQTEFDPYDGPYRPAQTSGDDLTCGCPDSLDAPPPENAFDVNWLGVGQKSGCELTVRAHFSSLDLRASSTIFSREFTVGFDTDNYIFSGFPEGVDRGAEYRAVIDILYQGGLVKVNRRIEQRYGSAYWDATTAVPYEVKLEGCALEFTVNLHDLGNPPGTIAFWCNTYAENVFQERLPGNIVDRMTLDPAPDATCPYVENIDTGQIQSGVLTDPIEVRFSEPVEPITLADVSITPSIPIAVAQGPLPQYLQITGAPSFKPGLYTVTLNQTIRDCSSNHLTEDRQTCGQPVTFSLCIPEPGLATTDGAGTPQETFPANQSVYLKATDVEGLPTSVNAYLVDADVITTPGRALIDQTSDGPNMMWPVNNSFGPTSLGLPARPGEYAVVLDVDYNGVWSAADRSIDPCDGTLVVNSMCDEPFDAGVLAYWPLDETYANAGAVELEDGHDGAWVGAPQPQAGKVHGALSFDGVNDEVDVPSNPDLELGTDDFSITGWISPADQASIRAILDKRSGNRGYHVALTNGHLTIQLMDAGGYGNFVSTAVVPVDTWTHFAITVARNDPNGLKLYLNGSLDGVRNPTAYAGDLTSGAPLRIGGHAYSTADRWKGKLDELTIWDDVLTQNDVVNLWYAGSTGGICPGNGPLSVLDPHFETRPEAIHFAHANPFRAGQEISFAIAAPARLKIQVLDASGRRVATLADEPFTAGRHVLHWDGRDAQGAPVSAGIYFLRSVGEPRASGTVVLLR